MELVEEIQTRTGGGFGGKRDESSDLSEMNYAEKMIFSDAFLKALKSLKVQQKIDGKMTGGNIILTPDDFFGFREDGKTIGMNGNCHKLNQVFVAGKMPFYATSYSTESAEKKTSIKKHGKNIGMSYTQTIADRVRVYRISSEFDISKYAVDGGNDSPTKYHTATTGVILRTAKNLEMRNLEF